VVDPAPVQSRNLELNQSISGLLNLVCGAHPLRALTYGLLALLIVTVTVVLWKRQRLPLEARYALLVLATVLVSPHFFVYDLVILMIPVLLLLGLGLAQTPSRSRAALLLAVCFLYSAPLIGLFLAIRLRLANAAVVVGVVFAYLAVLSLTVNSTGPFSAGAVGEGADPACAGACVEAGE